ncbi:MAG: DUF202 domain-containing protein [Sinobacteraceae bacterium]|nr:DUF202 domain-containing protein [Nevskiaceae bacterium]
MSKEQGSEQLEIMKRMLELAQQRTQLANKRTDMSAQRSRMSEERSAMSADRSRMSEDRSRMSAERSEMSEVRSYHNAERTLSAWLRTALSLMIFGIAIDRFGLLLHHVPGGRAYAELNSSALLEWLSGWTGTALVLLAVIMAAACGIRFVAFSHVWSKRHAQPPYHGPYLAGFFALAVTLFGLLLLIFMLAFAS